MTHDRGEATTARPLLRTPAFRWFLGSSAAEAVSDSIVKGLLPIVAVSSLGAGATAVGFINASSLIAFLAISLPVGTWLRGRRLFRVMSWSATARAITVLIVPLLALMDLLSVGAIIAVAAVIGVADVFFTNASSSALPGLVGTERMAEAYARRQSVTTAISVLSPLLSAAILRLLSGPYAMVVAAISYLGSSGTLVRLRSSGSPQQDDEKPHTSEGFFASMRGGVNFVFQNPVTRAVVLSAAVLNSAAMFGAGAETVYALNDLGIAPAMLVSVQAVGALGGFLSSLIAAPLVNRLGISPTFTVSCVVGAASVAILPGSPSLGIPPLAAITLSTFGWSCAVICASVAQAGVVPHVTPPDLLSRVMSNQQFVTLGCMPVAALVGGALADLTSPRLVLFAWAVMSLAASLPIVLSPVRSWRTLPPNARPT